MAQEATTREVLQNGHNARSLIQIMAIIQRRFSKTNPALTSSNQGQNRHNPVCPSNEAISQHLQGQNQPAQAVAVDLMAAVAAEVSMVVVVAIAVAAAVVPTVLVAVADNPDF